MSPEDVKPLLHFSEQVDVVVLGPGLGTELETQKAIKELLTKLEKPAVVDASALIPMNTWPKNTVLTPHQGEFMKLTGEEAAPKTVQKWAKELKAVIVCKGSQDVISDGTNTTLNNTGNPLMTVGGTGDVLAGFIGGLMAQGLNGFEAGELACKLLGQAGDNLAKMQGCLRALDLVRMIPDLLLKEHD